MSRFSGAMPAGSQNEELKPGATLTDEQMRRAIERGDIKREDLGISDRERYAQELKKGSLRAGYPNGL